MKNKQKGFMVYLVLLPIFLLGVGATLYYKNLKPINLFPTNLISTEPDGMNIYPDKDISINKISKDEFENEKKSSDQSSQNTISKQTKPSDSKNSYLNINNKEYITYPYNRDGNYQIFDYGVILRQNNLAAYIDDIYYLDLKTETIKQLSNEIRAYNDAGIRIYQNVNLAVVVYADRKYNTGDSGGNKDIKVVLFSKNGSKKIIAKFVNRSHRSPEVIDGFLKGDKFYFQVNFINPQKVSANDLLKISDQYYVANVLNYNFTDEDIFYDFKDVLTSRNVTDFKYEEALKICKSIEKSDYCQIDTAIKYNDESFCDRLAENGAWPSMINVKKCYSGMAVKKQNIDLCSKIPDSPIVSKNPEITRLPDLYQKEKCIIEAAGDLLVSDLNFCNNLKHPAVKEECILKQAILNYDEKICIQISEQYSITQQSCKGQVLKAKLFNN